MITIDDPPTIAACASCNSSPLIWLWSPRRKTWVGFVEVDRTLLRVHGCRHAQQYTTWRDQRPGTPPPREYLAARAALATHHDRSEGEA